MWNISDSEAHILKSLLGLGWSNVVILMKLKGNNKLPSGHFNLLFPANSNEQVRPGGLGADSPACCGELKKQSVGPSKIASGEQKLPLRRTHGGPVNTIGAASFIETLS